MPSQNKKMERSEGENKKIMLGHLVLWRLANPNIASKLQTKFGRSFPSCRFKYARILQTERYGGK
jgi:hypothetical protein